MPDLTGSPNEMPTIGMSRVTESAASSIGEP